MNVLDTLVVALKLDSSGFEDGRKKAEAEGKKLKESAVKQASEVEAANRKMAEGFSTVVKQAGAFFLALAGASSVKSFVADVTAATAALGRFASNMNIAPQFAAELGAAIERVGGKADEAASDIATLNQNLFDLSQNGKNIPVELQKLGAEAHVSIDTNHGLPAYLRSIATAAQELARVQGNNRDAFQFLTGAGIGGGLANLMISQGGGIDKYLGSLGSLAPTDDQIKKFTDLQAKLAETQQTFVAVARQVTTDFVPAMEKAADAFGKFVTQNRAMAEAAVPTWLKAMRDDAQQVVDVLNKIVDAENWLAAHNLGAAGAALANRFGPKAGGNGEATPIPWGEWGSKALKWLGDNWGIKGAGAADFGPGLGQGSHPHPASGLFIQGQQVSRGNPMPVTVVAGTETGGGGGLLSWLFGGGSPTSQGGGIASTISSAASSGSGLIAGAAKGLANMLGGGVGKAGGSNGSIDNRAMQLMDRLVKVHGWTPEAAAIAAGNAQQESGVRSDGPMGDPSTPGGSWGMFQWNRGRLDALKSYAASQKANWQDFNTQVDFFNQEARAKIPTWAAQHSLAGAGSISHAYEGFGDNSEGTRVGNSARFLKMYGARGAVPDLPHRPVSHTPLSTLSALHPVTTSSTSNSMHVGDVHVHGVDTNNAHSVASRITDALRQSAMTTSANFGQA